jgi:hypothetical protein
MVVMGCGGDAIVLGPPDARRTDPAIPAVDAPLASPDAGVDAEPAVDAPLDVSDAGPPDAPAPIDAPAPPDAGIPDALVVGDAGTTLTYSFHFDLGTDDLEATFTSDGSAMTWKADDGDPPGSLSFASIKEGTVKVTSKPGLTWEDLGVPPGALVANVRLASYKRRVAAYSDMDHSWAFQLVGEDNLPVHDGINTAYLELISLTHVISETWETVTDLEGYEVHPG